MFIWYLPQTPLRALRLGESLFVSSLAEAAENTYRYEGRGTSNEGQGKTKTIFTLLFLGES